MSSNIAFIAFELPPKGAYWIKKKLEFLFTVGLIWWENSFFLAFFITFQVITCLYRYWILFSIVFYNVLRLHKVSQFIKKILMLRELVSMYLLFWMQTKVSSPQNLAQQLWGYSSCYRFHMRLMHVYSSLLLLIQNLNTCCYNIFWSN